MVFSSLAASCRSCAENPLIQTVHFSRATSEIDNSRVENLIRPNAPNHNNALIAGRNEGRATWGRIASLIET